MFFDKNATVSRLSPTPSDINKEVYVILANIRINIQPASAELVAVSEGVYGQTFQAFTTFSGIEVGDLITVSGTNDKFTVKGVGEWTFPPIPHLEIVLFKGDI